MDTERAQATVNPEAWAAARVEEVVKKAGAKAEAEAGGPAEGSRSFLPGEPSGQVTDHQGRAGNWWVRWTDAATGKEHREKAGSRPAALNLYLRRRADVR
jgi:hypothetical protein